MNSSESCGRTGWKQSRQRGSEAKRQRLYFILDYSHGSNHLMGPSFWKHFLLVLVCVVSSLSRWITALLRLVPSLRISSHHDDCFVFCALIGRSWNILFYLIVCSPATQTPVSQSDAGSKHPIRFQTGVLSDQFGGFKERTRTEKKSVCVHDWISRPQQFSSKT